MSYPKEHKEIVINLLDGKFIVNPSPLFITLKNEQHEEFYKEFFKQSFGYELNIETEFAYLSSDRKKDTRTRDFVLFLAILCRELDYNGKNFKEVIEFGKLDIKETEQLLKQSSKWEILEKTSANDFDGFLSFWDKKNVVERKGDRFNFTKAVKLFFSFAIDIANAKLKEENPID